MFDSNRHESTPEDANNTTGVRRRSFLKTSGLAGVASISGISGCSGVGGKGTITVGVGVPMTGPYSAMGKNHVAAVKTAVAEQGKVNGENIEVISKDTQGKPSVARNVWEQLATEEGADFIIGPVSSACGGAITDIIDKQQILTNYPTAATRSAVGSNCSKYIFKTSPNNEQQVIAIAEWTAENLDGDVITFSADYTAGQEQNKYFKQYHEQAGGNVVKDMYAPLDTQDFSSYFSRIRDSNADIVFSFFAGGAAVKYLKQAKNFGLGNHVKRTGMGYLTTTDVLPAIGKAANGWITGLDYAETLDRPEFKAFEKLIRKQQDVKTPNLYHSRAYTASKAIFEVMSNTGSNKTEDIISGLEGHKIKAPHGDITYRAGDHQAILDYYIREVQDMENVVVDTNKNIITDDTCEAF